MYPRASGFTREFIKCNTSTSFESEFGTLDSLLGKQELLYGYGDLGLFLYIPTLIFRGLDLRMATDVEFRKMYV